MFENLGRHIEKALQTVKGQNRITEINIATTVKEIRRALIDADVHYKVAKEVTDEIKTKAMGLNVLTSISPGQLLTKVTQDELTALMGGQQEEIKIEGNPAVILMSGLQGSGKTTFSAKLANHLKKQGRSVLLTACDVYRPAAVEQLKVLGSQIGVDVFSIPDSKDVLEIATQSIQYAKEKNHRVVVVDTAGRMAVDEAMMNEIAALKKKLNPSEILFVVDAMTGQDAVNTAKAFNDVLNFDGVVLSKMDSDTRGGAALSIRRVVDKPIKFLSLGEKMDALEKFHPDRMAGRILGMGDVVSLVEKAQENFDVEEAKRLQQKMRKNQFNFNDFLQQIEQVKKLGSMKDVLGMIPGMNKLTKDVNVDDDAFIPIVAMIRSMTPKERDNPDIINHSRRLRIAKGSGTEVSDVNQLIKQFDDMRKMMKMMNKQGGMASMMKNLMR